MCCNCGPTLLISLAIHATGPASAIQRATFRTGDHHFVRSSFSSIRAELAKPGRDYGRTERACGSRYHLALDSTLRAGTQSALPAGTGQDEWLLACRETYLRIAGKWTIYLPNGNPQPARSSITNWPGFERLIEHGAELMKAGAPVVLAGDYNVVPTVQDIYRTRSLDSTALIQPKSRQAYARLLADGWTDALRKLQPGGDVLGLRT
jgi:hypothetical protein